MELSDIKKSLTQMTDDEIRSLLLDVRSSRRVSKKPPAPAKKAAVKKDNGGDGSSTSTGTLMKNITPEQAAELLKILGG